MLTVQEIQAYFDGSPAISALGLRAVAVDADKGTFEAQMPFKSEHERRANTGQFHGGPIASFIDTVGDFVVAAQLGAPVPTVNLRIDYLRPAFAPHVCGIATIRRIGKSMAVVDIDVHDAAGKLVAIGRGNFSTAVAAPEK